MGAPELVQGVAKPQPQVSSINRTHCSAATCTTCFLPHGQEAARAHPKQLGWTELCGPNPRALSRFEESGFGPQNYPEEVDGITRTYQGCRQAERRHSADGRPSLASRLQDRLEFVHTRILVPDMIPHAPGTHSCTAHRRDKPDGKHIHTRGPRR